jgi:ATP-binding cassette subfamily B protein
VILLKVTYILISNLRQFLEYKETIPEDYKGIEPDREITSIEFRNVSFSYDGVKMLLTICHLPSARA